MPKTIRHFKNVPKITILYQDDWLVAADKPAGIPTIPNSATQRESSLVGRLEKMLGSKLFIVHRLDKDTSGAIIFARDLETHKKLCRQFEKEEVEKVYWGIISGYLPQDEMEIDLPIAKKNLLTMQISQDGAPAKTRIKLLEAFRDYSLLEIRPVTGKKHQIRLHLRAKAIPLAIDPYYGTDKPVLLSDIKRGYKQKLDEEEKPLIARLPLHAKSISFIHPSTGKMLTFEAPAPKDFAYLLKMLEKYGR